MNDQPFNGAIGAYQLTSVEVENPANCFEFVFDINTTEDENDYYWLRDYSFQIKDNDPTLFIQTFLEITCFKNIITTNEAQNALNSFLAQQENSDSIESHQKKRWDWLNNYPCNKERNPHRYYSLNSYCIFHYNSDGKKTTISIDNPLVQEEIGALREKRYRGVKLDYFAHSEAIIEREMLALQINSQQHHDSQNPTSLPPVKSSFKI